MATTNQNNISRQFKDLDLNFNIHPVRKDINKLFDEKAIINAVKNIVLTNHYEKPFNPDYGSNVRGLLFENLDVITASAVEREIEQAINNYEPRIQLIAVQVIPDFENNGFGVQMQFYVVNRTEPVSINFLLERIR
jgi:phage baseplate assembly protein W